MLNFRRVVGVTSMEFLNLLENRDYLGWCIGYLKELKEKKNQNSKWSLSRVVESFDYLAREIVLYLWSR